jgi:hypothetical protein
MEETYGGRVSGYIGSGFRTHHYRRIGEGEQGGIARATASLMNHLQIASLEELFSGIAISVMRPSWDYVRLCHSLGRQSELVPVIMRKRKRQVKFEGIATEGVDHPLRNDRPGFVPFRP